MLCTDLDRTVIPNGDQSENQQARELFRQFCARPEILLVYVSGRHLELVNEAINQYELPVPDYAITDVGTKIYHRHLQQWQSLLSWENLIDKDWQGKSARDIQRYLDDFNELSLQEHSKQNTHKISYYIDSLEKPVALLRRVKDILSTANITATLIWSIDEQAAIGLLDIVPKSSTKLHAIEFLRKQLDYQLHETVFSGDSGNDLQVLESAIPSILVANAMPEIKSEATKKVQHEGHPDSLYIADGGYMGMNGNYTAGILEGINHFHPDILNSAQ
jgi:sucrose-6F-phosphate phosphohydrolase